MFTKMLILLVVLLLACNKYSSGLTSNPKISCIEIEKQALLKFKETVMDFHGVLSSWGSEPDKKDCCRWRGVKCNNHTGHITVLDLRTRFPLRGKISPSLLELQHLNYLDLSGNNFEGNYSPIPNHHLGNASGLGYLSLGGNYDLSGGNLEWLSYFPLLRHLDLNQVNLSLATNWLELVSNNLPLLEYLNLSQCRLPNQLPPTHPLNSSLSLTVIDLSRNSLSSIPYALAKMISLVLLNLAHNELEGDIPKSFANLSQLQSLELQRSNLTEQLPEFLDKLSGSEKSLRILNLEGNQLSGSLPDFSRFSSLTELYLSDNQLTGPFPTSFRQVLPNLVALKLSENQISGMLPDFSAFPSLIQLDLRNNELDGTVDQSIGQLSKLKYLDASLNSLTGLISEAHFSNLSSLKYLDFSYNSLVFKISSNWIPPFQLDIIRLMSCKLGPDFPIWMQNQHSYSELDVSGAGIYDDVPNWFWDLPTKLVFLNLSHNQMKGLVPDFSLKFSGLRKLDLSSNYYRGQIPRLPSNVTYLNLSKNLFSGSISFVCAITGLEFSYLDLSSNQLSGWLPDCWEPFQELNTISLANNSLSGKLPSSLGSLSQLEALVLSDNSFDGELPESLKNCSWLIILDMGGNRFTGNIQPWIGTHFTKLTILILRANKFYGDLPVGICQLTNIHILDFSQNNLSGKLPRCFNEFSGLRGRDDVGYISGSFILNYEANALIQWKVNALVHLRGVWIYVFNLRTLRAIDLSSNRFSGEIPQEIASLTGLNSLNLSRNDFTGKIVENFGQMMNLEVLDLSENRLIGEIPNTLVNLIFLEVLDLSNNNLSGRIPRGKQFDTFENSSYTGNPQLCGFPLSNRCPGEDRKGGEPPVIAPGNEKRIKKKDEDNFITQGFFISLGVGFAFGFWAILGTMLLSIISRFPCFKFLDKITDWLFVTAIVNFAGLQRRMQS